jgi:hypothetical protein
MEVLSRARLQMEGGRAARMPRVGLFGTFGNTLTPGELALLRHQPNTEGTDDGHYEKD